MIFKISREVRLFRNNIAYFKVFYGNISVSLNLLFLKSLTLVNASRQLGNTAESPTTPLHHTLPYLWLVAPPIKLMWRANQSDVWSDFPKLHLMKIGRHNSVFYALAKTAKSNLERDFFIHKTIGERIVLVRGEVDF